MGNESTGNGYSEDRKWIRETLDLHTQHHRHHYRTETEMREQLSKARGGLVVLTTMLTLIVAVASLLISLTKG